MKITGLAVWLVALGLVVLAQADGLAESPLLSGGDSGLFTRGRLLGGPSWWTRFGEPVNADAGDGKAVVAPAMYGDYIYGPGSCDCPPPCIDQLWSGYYQNPKRCNPYGGLFHGDCGNGGHGCGLFGHGKGCGCSSCVSCTKPACSAPVSCTTATDCGCKPLCGCKHAHLGHKWKCFAAHWSRDCCDSCSAKIGCGCAAAVPYAPQVQVPTALSRPQPISEEAALIALPRIN